MTRRFGQPRLPRGILHPMTALADPAPVYDPANGGQWIQGTPVKTSFWGCLLPLSEEDLRNAPQGLYTQDSRKLYTDGQPLEVGQQVEDPQDGGRYLVTGLLDYGGIHQLRRYVVERKGEAAK